MYRFTLSNTDLGTLALTHPPVQWENLAFEYERDIKYHGIGISIGLEADFVKEGFDYVKKAYQRFSIEADVIVTIERYDANTFEWKPLSYNGRLDFTKYNDEITAGEKGPVARTGIEQTGYTRQFLNLDDIEINLQKLESINGTVIPAFAEETQTITLHSKEIVQKYYASVPEQTTTPSLPITGNTTFGASNDSQIVQFGFDKVDVNEFNVTTLFTGFYTLPFTPEPLKTMTENGPVVVNINLNGSIRTIQGLGISLDDFDTASFKVYFSSSQTGTVEIGDYSATDNDGDFYRTFSIIQTFNLNLEIGDKIAIWATMYIGDFSGNGLTNYDFQHELTLNAGSSLSLTGYTTTPATTAEGLMAHEAFTRVVQANSDGKAAFKSDYFGRTDSQPVSYPADGAGSLLWITNGFQIRNFPIGAKPIFASFRSLFESLDALHCLGAGIETIDGTETLRVEPREYFYKDEVVLQLGCVSKFTRSVALEYFHNQAEFGYQQWQTEEKNGLEEFNSRQTQTLPLTQVKSKYSALSGYIASGYLLEGARRKQYVDSNTKDDRQDNNNFMVALHRGSSGLETERDQNATILTNVLSPSTVYNVRLSPARSKRRHSHWLKAGLAKRGAMFLKFNNGEGNYLMKSRLTGEAETVSENEDIPVSNLPTAPFIAEYYELEAPFTHAQQETFETGTNRYGKVEFTDVNGITRRGFVMTLKTNPVEQTGTFKLLRAING